MIPVYPEPPWHLAAAAARPIADPIARALLRKRLAVVIADHDGLSLDDPKDRQSLVEALARWMEGA